MFRLLLVLIVSLGSFAFATSLASEWIVLGNGGGYAGLPPGGNDGPFFLSDPEFTCPKGAPAPRKPGYRESIRLDHYGPNGCSGQSCTESIYARQSSCGGKVAYFKHRAWDKSEVYKIVGNDGSSRTYGFKLAEFEGKLYDQADYIPDPSALPKRKVVYCRSKWSASAPPEERVKSFEVLVESDALRSTTASVFLRETLPAGPEEWRFSLKSLEDVPVSKSITSDLRYDGQGFRLTIATAKDAGRHDGSLELATTNFQRGTVQLIPVTCSVSGL